MYKCVAFTFAQQQIFYMKACDSRYSQCLYFASSALSRKVEKLATECWAPVGLSPSHGYLLMIAIEEPGVQPSFLVEQLQLTPSTITRLIEKLEEKKLVVRTTEGKITSVFPTAKATEMKPLLKQCVAHFYALYSQALGVEPSAALAASMCSTADQLG
jgi:MarR family transcriptional regulator, organic hydroperoxide resistance regulator